MNEIWIKDKKIKRTTWRKRAWVATTNDEDALGRRDIEVDDGSQSDVLLIPIEGTRFVGVAVVPVPWFTVGLGTWRHNSLSLWKLNGVSPIQCLMRKKLQSQTLFCSKSWKEMERRWEKWWKESNIYLLDVAFKDVLTLLHQPNAVSIFL